MQIVQIQILQTNGIPKIFLVWRNANMKIYESLIICLLPPTLKVLHQQTLHSDIYTVGVWLLSYISLAQFRESLRKYFVSVWITKSLIRWSPSQSSARPHIADGGKDSRYRGNLLIYCKNCRGRLTRGDITVCILGMMLTSPTAKAYQITKHFTRSRMIWGLLWVG